MLKKENKILKRKMEFMMDLQMDYFTHLKDFENMSNNLKIFISKNSIIEAELNFIKKCYCEKEEKPNNIENKLELLKSKKESFNVRNMNKKIKYRDTQLEIKKNKINSLKNEENDDIRETIMKLLSMNVSMNSVNEVIKVVLNKLAKKNISRLPSAAVKCRLMQEASILGQFQVAEAMLENNLINKNSKIGNCLHGDGTQKYHRHYQNFQITTTSGKTLSFGLSEVVGKDAATVLQNFTNIVDDICDVVSNSATEKEINFAKLITSIKSTMSDLSSVNPLFNSQLKTLR
ncbi:uncharacterized protein LOC105850680 [Hydra vulgaris]|uniref:uncharacterized protein LOC105850680 n=1 Tax=Hydra vulgaris TaxID=6087 RepID=UPI0032E9E73E